MEVATEEKGLVWDGVAVVDREESLSDGAEMVWEGRG